jgi:hypothetical protein
MPTNRYADLQNDKDHIGNQNKDKKMPISHAPKPSDLGTGMASKVAQSLVDRKKRIDDASNY